MAEIFNFSTIEEKKRVLEVWATKNFIKDEMTGRVDIVGCILEKNCKKVKIEVTGPKKVGKLT